MSKLLTCILICLNFLCYSQVENKVYENNEIVKGYIIAKDNEYQQGFLLYGSEKENSEYIYFKEYKYSKPKRLDGNQINAFGSNEKYYELLPLNGDSVFMQKLNHQYPLVYYLHNDFGKCFYLKTQNRFEEIPANKEDLQEFLTIEMGNCSHSLENVKHARYSKQNLYYLFKRNEKCSSDRIPTISYGMYTGIKFSNLKLNDEVVYKYGSDVYFTLEDIDYMWKTGGFISLFLDFPLNVMDGKISFHPEIQYERSTYEFVKQDIEVDFGFDISYYTANSFFRYKTLNKKKPLFADFGFCYSAIDVSNAYIKDQELFHQLADYLIGVSVGGGVSLYNRFDMAIRSNYSLSHSMPKVFSLNLLIGIEL